MSGKKSWLLPVIIIDAIVVLLLAGYVLYMRDKRNDLIKAVQERERIEKMEAAAAEERRKTFLKKLVDEADAELKEDKEYQSFRKELENAQDGGKPDSEKFKKLLKRLAENNKEQL